MRYKEDWEAELLKKAGRRGKRKRQKMKVSGRSIIKIKELMAKRAGN